MQNFNEVDKDELLDILEIYKVQKHVRNDNIKHILEDAAHRTIIEASSYICRCWHALFVINELRPVLRANLADVCKQALPTDTIILPNPATEAERNTGKLLLKYVRSLSSEKLAAFLRYTTVRFVQQTDFERRPVAHTCGYLLELAPIFKDYTEFRSEFNAVLDAKIWVILCMAHDVV
ncbi:uncharacterized protein LOC119735023 isoform X2 [Patiria miniata]|uniref:Uncharacterized protein n=1 Tax=Patiria miniata TaxID=46514 RepID=A0A914AM99_PATMI|nr:uncharacterized protein LOC119735023 isoform X2 [Patiria miniata]